MLSFQRLDVYRCAVELLAVSSDADAARHYAIARGSAMECAALFDAMKVLALLDDAHYDRAIELLERIVAMLTKLTVDVDVDVIVDVDGHRGRGR